MMAAIEKVVKNNKILTGKKHAPVARAHTATKGGGQGKGARGKYKAPEYRQGSSQPSPQRDRPTKEKGGKAKGKGKGKSTCGGKGKPATCKREHCNLTTFRPSQSLCTSCFKEAVEKGKVTLKDGTVFKRWEGTKEANATKGEQKNSGAPRSVKEKRTRDEFEAQVAFARAEEDSEEYDPIGSAEGLWTSTR